MSTDQTTETTDQQPPPQKEWMVHYSYTDGYSRQYVSNIAAAPGHNAESARLWMYRYIKRKMPWAEDIQCD